MAHPALTRVILSYLELRSQLTTPYPASNCRQSTSLSILRLDYVSDGARCSADGLGGSTDPDVFHSAHNHYRDVTLNGN